MKEISNLNGQVIIRPLLSTKKTSGDLEVHTNGFRFLTKRGEKVDIIFSNIKHKKTIKDLLLSDYCSNGARYRQIDLVVIIIEASKRDFGTTRQLLEDVIIPTISADRILVAVNQADAAMKGHNWNKSRCRPQPKLSLFLERMSQNIQETIYHDIGVSIPKPIYYSSEFEYNINKLMDLIINHIPKQRRYISE